MHAPQPQANQNIGPLENLASPVYFGIARKVKYKALYTPVSRTLTNCFSFIGRKPSPQA
jgi:hypothetical protein